MILFLFQGGAGGSVGYHLEVKQRAEGTIPPVHHALGAFFPAPPTTNLHGNGREDDLLQPLNKF